MEVYLKVVAGLTFVQRQRHHAVSGTEGGTGNNIELTCIVNKIMNMYMVHVHAPAAEI